MTTPDPRSPGLRSAGSAWDLPEPAALRRRIRRLALEDPFGWPEMTADGTWLADWLWSQGTDRFEADGVTRELVARVVAGYRQELWLWLMGEHTWAHVLAGLLGRISRRATLANQSATMSSS